MGTECIFKDETDVMPAVPPGFAPLTSFTLQRVQEDVKVSACSSSNFAQSQREDCGDTSSSEKLKKSLRHRPWVNYSKFDNSSDEEENGSKPYERVSTRDRVYINLRIFNDHIDHYKMQRH